MSGRRERILVLDAESQGPRAVLQRESGKRLLESKTCSLRQRLNTVAGHHCDGLKFGQDLEVLIQPGCGPISHSGLPASVLFRFAQCQRVSRTE